MATSFLVFKDMLKFGPMEREKVMVCPMLASAWQKSRHCVTRADVPAPSGEEDISKVALADSTAHFHFFIRFGTSVMMVRRK